MPRSSPALACWLCLAACLSAAAPLEEHHDLVQLPDGTRVGSSSFAVVPAGTEGLLRASATLELSLRRNGSPLHLRREEATVETPEGKVVAVWMRQGAPGGRQLVLEGSADRAGGLMHVKVDGGRIERQLRWADEVVGLRQQQRLFRARKVRPGDRFSFVRYEPTYNALLTVRALVKEQESVEVLGRRRVLLRVELTPDALEAPGQRVRPPRSVVWLDEELAPVRRQVEMDGLGTLILTRTTKEKALAGGATGATADIGARSLVPLGRAVPRPYDTRRVVYRVTVTPDEAEGRPSELLIRDAHQEVNGEQGASFELVVHPVRPGREKGDEPAPGKEFLASCHYIDHDDARVRELARRAVGDATDEWQKALRIERWVKGAMRTDQTAPLQPASWVAQTLRGDCRHHAFLTAALCRAAGLPSRTAIGLLYVYRSGPKLGFHTWAEVYVNGRWLGLDSTLGKGGVSGAHVKITQHSWHDTASLTPLLPVSRVVGKLRVEVLRGE